MLADNAAPTVATKARCCTERIFLILSAVALVLGSAAGAQEREVTISSKEIVERLSRLEERFNRVEEGQKNVERRMDELQRNLEQRIAISEQNLAQRLAVGEQNVAQRFDDLRAFMLWGFGVTFAGMFTLIGFVLWDRRTALAPAVRRIHEVDDREQRVESALRDYAKGAPELADSLRRAGLL